MGLAGFLQACRIGRFDADEHPIEIGGVHQTHQVLILRQIDRDLGAEGEGAAVIFLPAGDIRQQLLGRFLVADHVVVDEEDAVHAEAPQRVEFAPDLIRALHARLASEHDDDVAEFAGERAPA